MTNWDDIPEAKPVITPASKGAKCQRYVPDRPHNQCGEKADVRLDFGVQNGLFLCFNCHEDGWPTQPRAKKCEECGKYPVDYPSKICVGCDAYRENQS